MKKLFSIILSLALVLSVCALSGCSGEIKQGSKIQRMILKFGFYDAEDNLVDTKDVQAELYLNFAPETTARFIELAEDGYFDNTCVSDVAAGYFEFGGYEYVDGKFTAKSFDDQKYPQLKGEFYNNGFTGNKLTTSAGALVYKHDAVSTKETSKYDTAKGTIIVALSAVGKFNEKDYCVFGKITTDDASDNPSSEADSSLVNRSGKSSLGIVSTLSDLISNDGVRTYYYEKEGVFYTRKVVDGENFYYLGASVSDDAAALDGEELEKIENLVSDSDPALLTLPYTKVVIKSVKKK